MLGITSLYAALAAITQLVLIVKVVRGRLRSKVLSGTGDEPTLFNASAALWNYVQYAPLALILLMLMELKAVLPPTLLHLWGAAFLISRIANGWALTSDPAKPFKTRIFGFQLTVLLLLAASGLLLFHGVHDSIVKPVAPTVRAGYSAAEEYSAEALQAIHAYTQDAMRLADSYTREAVERAQAAGSQAYDTAADVGRSTYHTAADVASAAADKASGVYDSAAKMAADVGRSTYDTAADAAAVAADKASDVYDSAAKIASDAYKSAEGLVKGASDKASDAYDATAGTATGASVKAQAAARDASNKASATAKGASRQADKSARDAARVAQDASAAAYDKMNAAYKASQDKLQDIYNRVYGLKQQHKEPRFSSFWGWLLAALVTAGMIVPMPVILSFWNAPPTRPASTADASKDAAAQAQAALGRFKDQVKASVKGAHAEPQTRGPAKGGAVMYTSVPATDVEPTLPGTTTGPAFQATDPTVNPLQKVK